MAIRSVDIEFRSGNELCRGWLLAPEPALHAQPCVVMAHGFGLTRKSGLRPFAERFAEEGYVVLLFDYRAFGDSEGWPRQVISFRTQLEDWSAAVQFARSLPEVDAAQVATWGFSLGAGHAVTTASVDDQIAAVVGIAPMLSGVSATLAAMRWWSVRTIVRLVSRGIRDALTRVVNREPVRVAMAAPAGDLGILTSPDAYPGYRAIVPDDFDFMVAARIGLHFWTYAPGRRLKRVCAPVLLMPSCIDNVCPPAPTLRWARRSAHVTIVELDCEHMEATRPPNRRLVIQESLAFLRAHLAPRRSDQPQGLRERSP